MTDSLNTTDVLVSASKGGTSAVDDSMADVMAACGLQASPFADDERAAVQFFFPSQQHLRALGFIGQLLWSRANLAVLTSEPGMGKSLLIQRLLADLDERVLIAHVQASAQDGPQEFLLAVLEQFGMRLDATDRSDRRRLLSRFLHHQYSQNRLCLLVVEGVQMLKPAVLEELRLIGELAVDERRIVKLLLLGAPSLARVIDSPRMASLTLGRAPRLAIESFSEDQVAAYVVHRLRVAGAANPDKLIPTPLMTAIHRYTAGRPQLINRLCAEAMVCAVATGDSHVTAAALTLAAGYLQLHPAEATGQSFADSSSTATSSSASSTSASTPELAEQLPLVEQALLLITLQGGADGVVPLLSSRILIGRGETADVRIDSAFVSRYHALIVREPALVTEDATTPARDLLIDLGSTNGVLVNGKREVRHQLKHRDLIQIGTARITYLNPALAPPLESDPAETLSFGRAGALSQTEAEQAILAFGRFNEAS
jgi:general secretion pathway protein A